MGKKINKDIIVGIDIGTSKVVTLVGEVNADGQIQLIGTGSHPSQGMHRGVVVNIESTIKSIQKSVEAAEASSGHRIHSAFTGIAGSHIRSLNSHGMVAIRDREVAQTDIERVIEAAKAIPFPADQKILHVLPQEYIIDKQDGIREPVGMSGLRLEAKVHIVTGAVSAAQNIVKCLQRCQLETDDVVLEQLASSHAILTEDEKELGVCIIDIGGGTSDIAIFIEGAIQYTAVIPIAGDQVTNDIAIALRTPARSAEEIKIKQGCALQSLVDPHEMIDIPAIVDQNRVKQLPRKQLAEVIEARYEELFTLAANEIRRSGLSDLLAAGVVLTGGASKVDGAKELAEKILGMPVRIGSPSHVIGDERITQNPIYATGVGLLVYGLKQKQAQTSRVLPVGNFKGLFSRMRNWFQAQF